jgi:hypothetical protein
MPVRTKLSVKTAAETGLITRRTDAAVQLDGAALDALDGASDGKSVSDSVSRASVVGLEADCFEDDSPRLGNGSGAPSSCFCRRNLVSVSWHE